MIRESVILGSPRIAAIRDWWTPERFAAVVAAVQRDLKQRGKPYGLFHVGLALSVSDRSLQRWTHGQRTPFHDWQLFTLDAQLSRILGPDWMAHATKENHAPGTGKGSQDSS